MKDKSIIFKALLFLLFTACSLFAWAQEPYEITCDKVMPVCSGEEIVLSVPDNYQYTFQWYRDNQPLENQVGNTLRTQPVRPSDALNDPGIYELVYSVEVLDQDSSLLYHPSFTVGLKPVFRIKFKQEQKTCSNRAETNGHTAQVRAWVDSTSVAFAPPFEYAWDVSPLHIAPGDDSWAVGLEAFCYYRIKVTDNRGCVQWDSTTLKAYTNPLVEILTDPDDTLYLQNPHVTFSFENKPVNDSIGIIDINHYFWVLNPTYNITSTEPEPRFTYVETGAYTTELKVYNPQGCDTSYFQTIQVEPVKLKIPNVFTPNGDNINDYFIIAIDNGGGNANGGENPSIGGSRGQRDTGYEYENYEPLSRYYESTELTIFNRWGRVVYYSKDYQNDWDGGGLSDGTYFYVLKCHGLKQDAHYQGSIMIVTAQRPNK